MTSLQDQLKRMYIPQYQIPMYQAPMKNYPELSLSSNEYSLPLQSFGPVSLEAEKADIWNCSECRKEFRTKQNLVKHQLTHGDKKLFECTEPGCDSKFQTSSGLYKHRKKHQNGSECYVCPVENCGKKYQTKYVSQETMIKGRD